MEERVSQKLKDMLRSCVLCPHLCRVDRVAGEIGICRTGAEAVISSAGPHFGEEPPLVGRGGSGTIFFAGCNLRCVFCQNYEISQLGEGQPISEEDLADLMLRLQSIGCHNINWVTPTHQIPAIFAALETARGGGLKIPVVYNCSGYERAEILRMLEGRVEIYMPDAKFLSPQTAGRYSTAPDYPEAMKSALLEMHRQVGDLVIRDGRAVKGLIIRHLVMPGGADESIAILDFIAREISPNSFVNVMDQYHPAGRAYDFPELSRRVAREEYLRVRRHAESLGLRLSD